MSLPRISIVVPSFLQQQYLAETLDSLVRQHYPNLEILVFDGGSTDGSVDVIQRYEPYLTYWQSQKDGGQAQAVRAGFERATGEWLGFLNSDDVLLPGALHALGEIAARKNCHWITGHCMRFSDSGPAPAMEAQIPKYLSNWAVVCPLYQPSTLWSRVAYDRVGGYPTSCRYSHDWNFWLQLAFAGYRPHLINRYLSGFRVHSTSATVSQQEIIRVEDQRLRDEFSSQLQGSELRRYKAFRQLFAGRDAMAAGRPGRGALAKGLLMAPEILTTRFGGSCLAHLIRGRGRTGA